MSFAIAEGAIADKAWEPMSKSSRFVYGDPLSARVSARLL